MSNVCLLVNKVTLRMVYIYFESLKFLRKLKTWFHGPQWTPYGSKAHCSKGKVSFEQPLHAVSHALSWMVPIAVKHLAACSVHIGSQCSNLTVRYTSVLLHTLPAVTAQTKLCLNATFFSFVGAAADTFSLSSCKIILGYYSYVNNWCVNQIEPFELNRCILLLTNWLHKQQSLK